MHSTLDTSYITLSSMQDYTGTVSVGVYVNLTPTFLKFQRAINSTINDDCKSMTKVHTATTKLDE